MSGLQFDGYIGCLHFVMFFLGVNITFFPMHFLGMAGMPRRIPDYPLAFAEWNLLASAGAVLSAYTVLLFLLHI